VAFTSAAPTSTEGTEQAAANKGDDDQMIAIDDHGSLIDCSITTHDTE